ncbi:MAG: tetratricopeptide repeat protein [Gemmatimonadota bacterium]
MALTRHAGTEREDLEIVRLQDAARAASDSAPSLERLGWTFVAKARRSYDPGYYKLAEQTALCLDSKRPDDPAGLLLRGHVLHQLHRFPEMEELARRLVAMRGEAFDHGLLGDALMEQGRLDEAVGPYQRMMDLKPGLQSYSRVAHLRWMKGDLGGAREVMAMAAQTGGSRDREAVAWAWSRLALFHLQAGAEAEALRAADAALALREDYAPALLARGQILLSRGSVAEAVTPLRRAAELNPLPEYQWALAEALAATGQAAQARPVEERLLREGAVSDPRTFAVYLATRGEQVETALQLAREELQRRQDVFTLDALAWAQAAAGKTAEARATMERALAHGTQDARLFYHAGVIADMAERPQEARGWFEKADAIAQMLLPSERERVTERLAVAPAA